MSSAVRIEGQPTEAPDLRIVPSAPKPHYMISGETVVDGASVQYTAEFPETLQYPGLVHIVNGFGGYKATSRWLRYYLTEAGFATCTSSPVRSSDSPSLDDITDSQALHAKAHREVQVKLAGHPRINEAPNSGSLDVDRTLWVPHSMGGLSVARFAEQNKDGAEAIVNLMAAGYGSPTLLQILKTVPKNIPAGIRTELLPYLKSDYLDVDLDNLFRIVDYYFRNPLRTAGEAWSCLTEDVRDRAERLRASGVKLGYIAAQYDCLVPADERIAEHVDDYRELGGTGHLAPQLKPQLVAQSIADIVINQWQLGL